MTAVPVWLWLDGEDADGSPVVHRRLAVSEDRPADVPEDAVLARQTAEVWVEEILRTGKERRYLKYLVDLTGVQCDVSWFVSARQIRMALSQFGLRDAVESLVVASGQMIKDYWEYSVEVDRYHPLVVSMLPVLNVTHEQADALWELAETL